MTPAERMARSRAKRRGEVERALELARQILDAARDETTRAAAAEIIGLLSAMKGRTHGD